MPGNLDKAPRLAGKRGTELRQRAEQALRIGMTGRAEQFGRWRLLNLAAGIHDHDALGDFSNHAEIMGDQNDRRADTALEVEHQLQDLRLDRHVQRRGRLVGNQELGVAGECHGDHHALAHAAGELMRILAHAPRRLRDTNQRQHLDAACLCGLLVEPLMDPQCLANLAADSQHRIEARHRLLEYHRNVVAADGAHLAVGELQQILSLEADRARDLAWGLRDEPHERHGGDRLAAAGFTDDGQRLAFVDMEGDAVDRAVDALRGTEMSLQILDFEQCHQINNLIPGAGSLT